MGKKSFFSSIFLAPPYLAYESGFIYSFEQAYLLICASLKLLNVKQTLLFCKHFYAYEIKPNFLLKLVIW